MLKEMLKDVKDEMLKMLKNIKEFHADKKPIGYFILCHSFLIIFKLVEFKPINFSEMKLQ